MSTLVRSNSFILEQPPKKRKKFTRSATGCKACRIQRVKCPEGPVLPTSEAGKVICKRCWETDTPCYYPANGKSIRRKSRGGDGDWERAAPGHYWEDLARQIGSDVGGEEKTDGDGGEGEWDWNAFISDIQTTPLLASHTATILPVPPTEDETEDTPNAPASSIGDVSSSKARDSFALVIASRRSTISWSETSPSLDWFQFLHAPAPQPALNTFTIASLLSPDIIPETSRPVVSYFEHEGYNEIVSTNKQKHNWIFTQLFPRLFATLSMSPPNPDTVGGLVREWLQACLVQLSYVHRGNVERDPSRRYIWRTESEKARRRSNSVLLRAKVRYPEGQWKTEEYLLKDLIALYSVVDHACAPLSLSLAQTPRFLMPPTGPEWVERFVGFSRRLVIKLGEVTGLVINSWNLLQSGTDAGVLSLLLRTQAERLLCQLGDGWDWEEHPEDVGQSDRTQRGNGVMRCALQTLLLCEILDVDLDDPRLLLAKERAIELVVDTEPSTIGGFQWPVTILAIYSRDKAMRERLLAILDQVLTLSFGSGYRGPGEVLELCWEVVDTKGKYRNGIAPWRDALAAFEISLFL